MFDIKVLHQNVLPKIQKEVGAVFGDAAPQWSGRPVRSFSCSNYSVMEKQKLPFSPSSYDDPNQKKGTYALYVSPHANLRPATEERGLNATEQEDYKSNFQFTLEGNRWLLKLCSLSMLSTEAEGGAVPAWNHSLLNNDCADGMGLL